MPTRVSNECAGNADWASMTLNELEGVSIDRLSPELPANVTLAKFRPSRIHVSRQYTSYYGNHLGVSLEVKFWKKFVLTILTLCICVFGYFLSVFVLRFQLLGYPVRNNEHGWLGPTPRSSSCVEDAGKVNYWKCDDVSVFKEHRIGSALWLRLNGLR
jgi:hypothetical protein